VVEPEQRGLAFGLYNFILGLAALPASLMFGSVWERVGFQTAFLLGAALALVASALLIISTRSVRKQHEYTA
jgi:predicted MFS family arabinose efflux permease